MTECQHDSATQWGLRSVTCDICGKELMLDSAMTEWQPIETAPKDGSKILIWAGRSFQDPDFHIAAWEEDFDPGKGDPPRMRWCTDEEGGHGSQVAFDDSDVRFWKPLDPPA